MRRLADAAKAIFRRLKPLVCAGLLAAMALPVPIAFAVGIAGLVEIVAADLADPLVVRRQIFAGPGIALGLPHALGYAR